MDSIPKDSVLEFNSDTQLYLRKQYNLDGPERIEEAINILEEWVKKQQHFKVKEFRALKCSARDYLERTIIISKGSVERAKIKLDRICTYRALYPNFFGVRDLKSYQSLKDLPCAFMPKLTKEHYRVFVLKNQAKSFPKGLTEIYRYFFTQCEYIQAHDYCNGIVLFLDYAEASIMETLKAFDVTNLRQALLILKEGYGMRMKGIHLLSESKAIDAVVGLFKQVLSVKLASRIVVHKTVETFYEYSPKEILPKEYGGNEKTLLELHDQFLDTLTAKEFREYLVEINKATTNEDLRIVADGDKFLGLPGTFRTLGVD